MAGAVAGLAFTAWIFFVTMPLDLLLRWSIARNAGPQETKDILGNDQERDLILYGSAQKIHFACRQALLFYSWCEKMSMMMRLKIKLPLPHRSKLAVSRRNY